MTNAQELAVRRNAARHLVGTPARQNAAQIDRLETLEAIREMEERFGADELARCNAMADSH